MHPPEEVDGSSESRREGISPGQILIGAGMMFVGTLVIYTAVGVFCVARLFGATLKE